MRTGWYHNQRLLLQCTYTYLHSDIRVENRICETKAMFYTLVRYLEHCHRIRTRIVALTDFFAMQSSIGPLFDARSMLTDVSGAGNNWAHGHHYYGPQYGDQIMELVRMEAEQCDSLQGFLMLHSLGGGTGSGLGSYLLGRLEVLHPFRCCAVMNWAALETVQLLTFRDGHDRIESCTPRSLLEHDVKVV